MEKEFEVLAKMIRDVSQGDTVIYVPDGGNWGDALIREATLLFFKENDIPYHEIPFHDDVWWSIYQNDFVKGFFKDKILLFGGGGAWYELYHSGATFVSRFCRYFKQVIVLPSTFVTQIEATNVLYFCRDKFESKRNCPDAIFCHDMAFYMKLKGASSYPSYKVGYFFRQDIESAGLIVPPAGNIDISGLGNEVTPIQPFISCVLDHEIIYTDRLHVAIAACLGNRKVFLHSGKYFKNEAIFNSSIQGYFNDVTFCH